MIGYAFYKLVRDIQVSRAAGCSVPCSSPSRELGADIDRESQEMGAAIRYPLRIMMRIATMMEITA
jgi:hypothetical protein